MNTAQAATLLAILIRSTTRHERRCLQGSLEAVGDRAASAWLHHVSRALVEVCAEDGWSLERAAEAIRQSLPLLQVARRWLARYMDQRAYGAGLERETLERMADVVHELADATLVSAERANCGSDSAIVQPIG